MDTCYYAIIERSDDGSFAARVPDLPGVSASGQTEDEVVRRVFNDARECLRNLIVSGQPMPAARPVDELPPDRGGWRHVRRLLLVIS